MDKGSIVKLLEEKNQSFLQWLEHQEKEKWQQGPDTKWTTGQHALHLLQSLKPLNDALSIPKFMLRYKFGKANREVRDYDTVVKRYQQRLKEAPGIVFKGSQNMKVPTLSDKYYIVCRLQVENKKLQYKTKKMSDKNLDTLVLPHPLMGKMPVREIIMWSAYHIEHHLKILQENY